jgi:hypothetical protein
VLAHTRCAITRGEVVGTPADGGELPQSSQYVLHGRKNSFGIPSDPCGSSEASRAASERRFRSHSDQTSNSGSSGPIIPSLDFTSLRDSPTDAAEFPNDGEGGVAEGDERIYLGDADVLGVLGGQLDGAADVGGGYGCPRRAPGLWDRAGPRWLRAGR